jgi:tetratricopeptide (TPR) repeat protein
MVGACGPLGQGRRFGRFLAAFAVLPLLSAPALADRRDQRAADLYIEGVKLIRQGKFREGAGKVNAALARGATEPVEAQGSETRFQARPYDPYYWLGVAQMETGLLEQALVNFEKSATLVPKGRSQPVLADAPAEWADLARRRAALLARLEPPAPTPTAVVAAAPEPTPTPFAVRLPERVPPTPAAAVAAAPTPSAGPAPSPAPGLPASTLALRDDLAALLADPAVALRAEEPLRKALGRLEAALRRGASAAAAEEQALRRDLASGAGAALPRAALAAGLEAQRDRRYADAARLARLAARLVPEAPQPHLLRCAALGAEWVLGGETRADLAAEAREALGSWLSRRPAGAPPSPFLSPALRERLERPASVPSRG